MNLLSYQGLHLGHFFKSSTGFYRYPIRTAFGAYDGGLKARLMRLACTASSTILRKDSLTATLSLAEVCR